MHDAATAADHLEATYRLIENDFSCATLDWSSDDTSGAVFEVLGENAARVRLELMSSKSLTPLIGRDQELSLLESRWEQVLDGAGQCVLIHGEPGIGKSRFVQALKEKVAGQSGTWLVEWHCLPYEQNTALFPVSEFFKQVILAIDETNQSGRLLGSPEEPSVVLDAYGDALPGCFISDLLHADGHLFEHFVEIRLFRLPR